MTVSATVKWTKYERQIACVSMPIRNDLGAISPLNIQTDFGQTQW